MMQLPMEMPPQKPERTAEDDRNERMLLGDALVRLVQTERKLDSLVALYLGLCDDARAEQVETWSVTVAALAKGIEQAFDETGKTERA